MKRFLALICLVSLMLPCRALAENAEWETAAEAVRHMRIGWILANTFDSYGGWIATSTKATPTDFETAWGNPVTTRELIHCVKDAGFGAVRVPVTFAQHIDESGRIEQAWLDRVAEVVGYVLDEGLYCVLNTHHDTGVDGWLHATRTDCDATRARFVTLWTQLATRFEPCGERLIFESFNEILDEKNEWNTPAPEALAIVNEFNQAFVDAVRATGGNNARRNLAVNTYAAANTPLVLGGFALPTDAVEGRLMAQVHSYDPWAFTSKSATWTAMTDVWSPARYPAQLVELYNRLDETFLQKGIPVIVGEFGSEDKNNTADRAQWAQCVVKIAAKHGIPCFYWDTSTFALLDRRTLTWTYPEIVAAMMDALPAN